MKRFMLNPFLLFVLGLVLGVISRVFDIYFETLGNIFSQMAIYGFHFVLRLEQVIIIFIILMVTAAAAISFGTFEVKKIKAYECCMRKE